MVSLRLVKLLAVLGFAGMLLSGCAGKNAPVNVSAASQESPVAVRDSLRAKFVMTIVDSLGKEQELDAVLFSVPGQRYRMELTGPMGIGVASLLWTTEKWDVVFPTEKMYVEGVGYMVGLIGDNTIPMVPIHQVADLFDGILIPQNGTVLSESDSAGFHVVREQASTGMVYAYGKKDGEIAWFMRGGRDGKPEVLQFSGFKEFEGVRTPETIVFERDGKMFLKIRIKKVARNKTFSPGTWHLNIPKSYKRVGA